MVLLPVNRDNLNIHLVVEKVVFGLICGEAPHEFPMFWQGLFSQGRQLSLNHQLHGGPCYCHGIFVEGTLHFVVWPSEETHNLY